MKHLNTIVYTLVSLSLLLVITACGGSNSGINDNSSSLGSVAVLERQNTNATFEVEEGPWYTYRYVDTFFESTGVGVTFTREQICRAPGGGTNCTPPSNTEIRIEGGKFLDSDLTTRSTSTNPHYRMQRLWGVDDNGNEIYHEWVTRTPRAIMTAVVTDNGNGTFSVTISETNGVAVTLNRRVSCSQNEELAENPSNFTTETAGRNLFPHGCFNADVNVATAFGTTTVGANGSITSSALTPDARTVVEQWIGTDANDNWVEVNYRVPGK